ncbi:hypothetical protein ACQKWADRAFT_288025 [Trichoderma austrokoningii]
MRKKLRLYFSLTAATATSTIQARCSLLLSFPPAGRAWAWGRGKGWCCGCRFWMSFGGGGQAVGQGGRPSGTSKVQHFPSTTDSEFRRQASRQTRVKKFTRFAICDACTDWIGLQ